jgi:hypothetical protein
MRFRLGLARPMSHGSGLLIRRSRQISRPVARPAVARHSNGAVAEERPTGPTRVRKGSLTARQRSVARRVRVIDRCVSLDRSGDLLHLPALFGRLHAHGRR